MREVPAFRKREPHDRVSRLTGRKVYREIRRRTRVWLDIDILDAEKLFRQALAIRVPVHEMVVPGAI